MKLEVLHAIVRANFACKNPNHKVLVAEPLEGNFQLPMLFFCHMAREMNFTEEQVGNFLGITWAMVTRYINDTDKLEIGSDMLHPEHQFNRKMALIRNGIRIHEMSIKIEKFYIQMNKT